MPDITYRTVGSLIKRLAAYQQKYGELTFRALDDSRADPWQHHDLLQKMGDDFEPLQELISELNHDWFMLDDHERLGALDAAGFDHEKQEEPYISPIYYLLKTSSPKMHEVFVVREAGFSKWTHEDRKISWFQIGDQGKDVYDADEAAVQISQITKDSSPSEDEEPDANFDFFVRTSRSVYSTPEISLVARVKPNSILRDYSFQDIDEIRWTPGLQYWVDLKTRHKIPYDPDPWEWSSRKEKKPRS